MKKIFFFAILFFLHININAKTIYVYKFGDNSDTLSGIKETSFSNIQSAINSSETGDTIFIFGITEFWYTKTLNITKSGISIIGEDSANVNIYYDIPNTTVITILADSVTIKNVSVQNGQFGQNNIKISNCKNILIENCYLNSSFFYGGVLIENSSNIKLKNNLIINVGDYGISILNSETTDISLNKIYTNIYAVYLENSTDNRIYNNIFKYNNSTGIVIKNSSDNFFINNSLESNGGIGISLLNNSLNNIIYNNLITYSLNKPISIESGCTNNSIKYNNMFKNKYGFTDDIQAQFSVLSNADDMKPNSDSMLNGFTGLSNETGICPDIDINYDYISDNSKQIYNIGYYGFINPFEIPVNSIPSCSSLTVSTSKSYFVNDKIFIYDTQPAFTWHFTDADNDTQTDFHFQISRFSDFSVIEHQIQKIGYGTFSYTLPETCALNINGDYYFRLRVNDNSYNPERTWSPYASGTFSFILNTPPYVSILNEDTFTFIQQGFSLTSLCSDSEYNIASIKWQCLNNSSVQILNSTSNYATINFNNISGRFIFQCKVTDIYGEYNIDTTVVIYSPELNYILPNDTYILTDTTTSSAFTKTFINYNITDTVTLDLKVYNAGTHNGNWKIKIKQNESGGYFVLKKPDNIQQYNKGNDYLTGFENSFFTIFDFEYYDKNGISSNIRNSNLSGIELIYEYNDTFSNSLSNSNLSFFYFDETDSKWIPEQNYLLDLNEKIIKLTPSHFSVRGIFSRNLFSPPINILPEIIVYPNPFIPNDGNYQTGKKYDGSLGTGVYFGGLPDNTEIEIYTVSGSLIFQTKYVTGNNGYYQWNVKNNSGIEIASGVYIVLFKYNVGKTVKKLAIIK
ncbi:right-handed parallel beta-helix repeat-containing protein [Candidatus Dependentiae bacterium]|nr:right-handed parallel beta-helix repeat-containing protein [Candidatus Dependentiae bacterium]